MQSTLPAKTRTQAKETFAQRPQSWLVKRSSLPEIALNAASPIKNPSDFNRSRNNPKGVVSAPALNGAPLKTGLTRYNRGAATNDCFQHRKRPI
tara:strand:+ start:3115 stop:3396 length:282 start_codon:yes stop_codon:yes gene_type:complete